MKQEFCDGFPKHGVIATARWFWGMQMFLGSCRVIRSRTNAHAHERSTTLSVFLLFLLFVLPCPQQNSFVCAVYSVKGDKQTPANPCETGKQCRN